MPAPGVRLMNRAALAAFVEHPRFQNFILVVIVLNAIILGLETSETAMAQAGELLLMLDTLALSIFVVEIGLKLLAFRLSFFRSGWNVFDFLIVAISLAPATEGFAVLRALRILRVLRAVSLVPSLRRVVEGLIKALPGMGSVFMLMSLIFYIGSVMATKLFGAAFPDWFGDIGNSAYSLFQIMTLESWSMGIVRPVMEVFPWAWAFFVPFILVTTFAVVNLVVGLVVNSMQEAHSVESVAQTDEYRENVLAKLAAIEARLDTLAPAKEERSRSQAAGE
jgi:voltage-gated sodium channel